MGRSTCEECGEGYADERTLTDHAVRIGSIPFVVPEATLGVCRECGATYPSSRQYERWRRLFEEHQRATGNTLSPAEIRSIRERTGLTMTEFAQLIGATRQSLSHWESDDRQSEPSRMVDLLLRLVRESLGGQAIDVLGFMAARARQLGLNVDLPQPTQSTPAT
jgi:putative zinc finger/helix-turn-helix YgiT family protein